MRSLLSGIVLVIAMAARVRRRDPGEARAVGQLATAGAAAAGSSPCPASPPGDGSACGPQGLTCEYGSSHRAIVRHPRVVQRRALAGDGARPRRPRLRRAALQGDVSGVVRVGPARASTARRSLSLRLPAGAAAPAPCRAGTRVPARRLGRRPTWVCPSPGRGLPACRAPSSAARAPRRRSSATTGRAPSQAATRRPAREGSGPRAGSACPAKARP